jgi:hypothetical protein
VKLELVFGEGMVEKVAELGAENDAQSVDVKQEVGSGRNPAGAIEG